MPGFPVQIEHCARSFGSHAVLTDVSFTIAPSRVFGLVGLNGAGKTTLIRILLGLLKAGAGSVELAGFDPWKHHGRMYRSVGVVLEHDGFSGNLSFGDNMLFFARARGMTAEALRSYLDTEWGSSDIGSGSKLVKHFSRGQRMQAALARAFAGAPEVCVLDEPTIALDVRAYDHFCRLVRRARDRGAAVLVSSHQLGAIEELCDVVGILQNGAITMIDKKENGGRRWLFGTDARPETGALIEASGGAAAVFESGTWRCSVADAEAAVPRIVAALVGAGRSVGEVRRESGGFSEEIRKIYS